MIPERTGLIVWLQDMKPVKNLDRFGTLHYVSKKMQYAVLYVNKDREEEAFRGLNRLPYVRKVERSYRNEIPTEYNHHVPDPTQLYTS